MESISIFSKYKDDQRIQKEISKRQKTIEKARNRWLEKIQKEIENSKNNIVARNEKQLARFEKKQRIQAEKKARDILWVKQTKKTIKRTSDSVKYWRSKAYTEFQLYARISRADSDGRVMFWDGTYWYYNQNCDWWHIYSKHNYPHIAFEILNCRPIGKQKNKMQWDNTADWQAICLSKKDQWYLWGIAQDATPEYKKQFQTKEYYQEQYEKYKELNKVELERLKTL